MTGIKCHRFSEINDPVSPTCVLNVRNAPIELSINPEWMMMTGYEITPGVSLQNGREENLDE